MRRLFFLSLTFWSVATAAALTDDQLLASLDLVRPGLQTVAVAVAQHNTTAAKHALAEYFRHRETPRYFIALGEKANPKPLHPDISVGERALRHEVVSIGYPH